MRKIHLRYENLQVYETAIDCELPMPKNLIDGNGKLFQETRNLMEPGQGVVTLYAEVPVTYLTNVEVVLTSPSLEVKVQ